MFNLSGNIGTFLALLISVSLYPVNLSSRSTIRNPGFNPPPCFLISLLLVPPKSIHLPSYVFTCGPLITSENRLLTHIYIFGGLLSKTPSDSARVLPVNACPFPPGRDLKHCNDHHRLHRDEKAACCGAHGMVGVLNPSRKTRSFKAVSAIIFPFCDGTCFSLITRAPIDDCVC